MPNLKSFKQQNQFNHHRNVFVVSGDWHFCFKQLETLIDNELDTWYLGDKPTILAAKFINHKQATQYLGQQCQQLIINAHHGFDLNAFGALTGCVVAGGSCFIVTPHFDDWQNQADKQHKWEQKFKDKTLPNS